VIRTFSRNVSIRINSIFFLIEKLKKINTHKNPHWFVVPKLSSRPLDFMFVNICDIIYLLIARFMIILRN